MPNCVTDNFTYRLSYVRMDIFSGSEACQAAAAISHNHFIWAINILLAIECIVGLVFSPIISVRLFKHEIFHINQRILLVLIGIMLAVRSVLTMYKRGLFLWRLLTVTDECGFVWSTEHCRDISAVVSEPEFAVGYCYLAISLERAVACVFGSRYENKSSPLLGIVGALAIILNTIIVSASHFSSAFSPPPPLEDNCTYIVFCTSVAYSDIRWTDMFYKFRQFPVMSASMLIFIPVFLYTKHKNRLRVTDSKHSLADRFHLRMTLKSTRIIYPNLLVFTALYAISSTCTTVAVYLQSEGCQVKLAIVIKELGSLIFNAHLIAHPLILIWREPLLWRSGKKRLEDQAIADTTTHFNMVRDAWDKVKFETKKEANSTRRKKQIGVWKRLRSRIALALNRGVRSSRTSSPQPDDTHPQSTPRLSA